MVPERGRVIPMIERTVVVLPMPLRPRRLTTCDAGTSSEMPNSTWLRPYDVCRSRTSSMNRSASGFLAKVGPAHFRVRPDLLGQAGGDDAAVDQHRDAVGELEHRVHVVLDQDHGLAALERGEELDHALRLVDTHAGHWLVEQEQARTRGERHRYLELAMLAMRQVRG